MVKAFYLSLIAFVLTGCASTQLNYNTLDIASSVGDLQTHQILYNISQYIDNPYALPTHIDLGAGSASTTNSVSPSIGTPLGAATGVVSTITRAATGAITGTSTQSTTSNASTSLSIGASDQWGQNWAYTPVTDSDELRRLRALYAYALGDLTDRQFRAEYPLVRKTQGIGFGSVLSDAGTGVASIYCPSLDFKQGDATGDAKTALNAAVSSRLSLFDQRAQIATDRATLARLNSEAETAAQAAASAAPGDDKTKKDKAKTDADALVTVAKTSLDNDLKALPAKLAAVPIANERAKLARRIVSAPACSGVTLQTQIPDEQFLREPSCVICMGGSTYGVFQGASTPLYINPRLATLRGHWILSEKDRPNDSMISLGHYKAHDIYIRPADRRKLSEFTLFVLTATAESAASVGAPGSTGGGSSGSKKNLLVESLGSSGSTILQTTAAPTQPQLILPPVQ